jgi:hypothetical protein
VKLGAKYNGKTTPPSAFDKSTADRNGGVNINGITPNIKLGALGKTTPRINAGLKATPL